MAARGAAAAAALATLLPVAAVQQTDKDIQAEPAIRHPSRTTAVVVAALVEQVAPRLQTPQEAWGRLRKAQY
jgi:hypothetical protein